MIMAFSVISCGPRRQRRSTQQGSGSIFSTAPSNHTRRIFSPAILALTLCLASRAGAAAPREEIWSAQPLGMGNTYTGAAGTGYAQVWNPAFSALAIGRNADLSNAAPAMRGAGLPWNQTSFDFVEASSQTLESYGFWWRQQWQAGAGRQDTFALNFARPVLDVPHGGTLAAGANLKYLDNLVPGKPTRERNAVGVDLGLTYAPSLQWLIGIAGRDLNEPRTGFGLDRKVPAKIGVGASYRATPSAVWVVDLQETFGRERTRLEARAGLEESFLRDGVALRIGADSHYTTAGLGVRLWNLKENVTRLDYAFAYPRALDRNDRVHLLTLSMRFGAKKAVAGLPGVSDGVTVALEEPKEDQKGERPLAALLDIGTSTKKRQTFVLGPGDVLKIEVSDHPELDVNMPVDDWGFIKLAFIGDISVAGMTAQQVAEVLEKIYAGFFMEGPHVEVAITDYNSRLVYVYGAVRTPGRYNMKGDPLKLSEVIMMAGLPTDRAAIWRVFVISQTPKGPVYRHVNLYQVLYRGRLEHDVELKSGDIVYVPTGLLDIVTGYIGRVLSPIFGLSSNLAVKSAGL
jgi:polysaccharide export outer membrane protein